MRKSRAKLEAEGWVFGNDAVRAVYAVGGIRKGDHIKLDRDGITKKERNSSMYYGGKKTGATFRVTHVGQSYYADWGVDKVTEAPILAGGHVFPLCCILAWKPQGERT